VKDSAPLRGSMLNSSTHFNHSNFCPLEPDAGGHSGEACDSDWFRCLDIHNGASNWALGVGLGGDKWDDCFSGAAGF